MTRYLFFYLLSLIFYFFSLLSKEMALTLPLFLILYDFSFRGFKGFGIKKIMKNYSGYVFVTLFYLFLRFFYFRNPVEKFDYYGGVFWNDLFTLPRILISYIQLIAFPLHLSAEHIIIPSTSFFKTSVIGSTALLVLIFLLIWKSYGLSRKLFFSSCWFFVTLLPVSNLVPIANPTAERYLYIPFVEVSLVMAIFLVALFEKKVKKRFKKIYHGLITSVIMLLLVFYSILTIKRNLVWRN